MSKPESSRPAPPCPHISALNDHLGYWLRFVSNPVSHAFGRRVEKQGVTLAEWVILRQAYAVDSTSVGGLAEETGLTRSAVSKLVDRLVAKRLLAKHGIPGDKRRQDVTLTAAGTRLVPKLARLADENDRHFFAPLTAGQRKQLRELLQHLALAHRLRDTPVE